MRLIRQSIYTPHQSTRGVFRSKEEDFIDFKGRQFILNHQKVLKGKKVSQIGFTYKVFTYTKISNKQKLKNKSLSLLTRSTIQTIKPRPQTIKPGLNQGQSMNATLTNKYFIDLTPWNNQQNDISTSLNQMSNNMQNVEQKQFINLIEQKEISNQDNQLKDQNIQMSLKMRLNFIKI